MTTQKPKGEWAEIMQPIIDKFRLAAKINQSAMWDAKGSAAMAELLTEMADKLDEGCRREHIVGQ
jgi:hypothetical protein